VYNKSLRIEFKDAKTKSHLDSTEFSPDSALCEEATRATKPVVEWMTGKLRDVELPNR